MFSTWLFPFPSSFPFPFPEACGPLLVPFLYGFIGSFYTICLSLASGEVQKGHLLGWGRSVLVGDVDVPSFPTPQSMIPIGSFRLAMVGVFTPQILANTTNQVFSLCL